MCSFGGGGVDTPAIPAAPVVIPAPPAPPVLASVRTAPSRVARPSGGSPEAKKAAGLLSTNRTGAQGLLSQATTKKKELFGE